MKLAAIGLIAASALVSACGEKVQTIPVGGDRKTDSAAWNVTDNGFVASGWTPGNEASWDAQLKKRTQGQNDYAPRQ